MKNSIEFLKKHKEIVLYLVFGVLTTLVNIAAYYVFAHSLYCTVTASTIIAWVFAVLFAYITNKIWVFECKCYRASTLLREAASFFAARAFSGALDIGIMYLFVAVLHYNDIVVKLISNVFVIIINYIFSKFWVFKKNEDH